MESASEESAGSSYTVMLNEQTAMVLDQGGYQLVGPSGAPNKYIVSAFNRRVQDAACSGIVGTCVATIPNIGSRRRRLQTSANASLPTASVNVSLIREYDFAASNTSQPVADLVQNEGGVGVVAAETTALSATTTVTVLGEAGSSTLADAVGEEGLGMALGYQMPTLVVDIKSATTTPPEAPPNVPPPPSDPPPMIPQPKAPPPSPMQQSSVSVALVAVGAACGVLSCCLVIGLLYLWRQMKPSGAKSQPRARRTTAMTAVVPGNRQGTTANAATGTSPAVSRGATPLPASGNNLCNFLPRRRVLLADGTIAEIIARADTPTGRPQSRDSWMQTDQLDAVSVAYARSATGHEWHPNPHDRAPRRSDLIMDDLAVDDAYAADSGQLPTPRRLPGQLQRQMMPATEARVAQAQRQVGRVHDLMREARERAEAKRAALEFAQQRLQSLGSARHAARNTRAPVMAARAAVPRPRMDQVLPPARNVHRESDGNPSSDVP